MNQSQQYAKVIFNYSFLSQEAKSYSLRGSETSQKKISAYQGLVSGGTLGSLLAEFQASVNPLFTLVVLRYVKYVTVCNRL